MDTMVMHPEVLSVTGLPKVVAKDVNVYYGDKHALKDVSVEVPDRGVMAFIGPSGCGKSTFLRCINRMNDTIPSCARYRQDHHRQPGHLRPEPRRGAAARPCRHGVPEAQPVSEVDLRERGVRPAHPRVDPFKGRPRRDRTVEPAKGRPVERGKGSPRQIPAPDCPAASSSACASRAPLRSTRKSSSWTSRARHSIPIATARIEELIDDLRKNYCIIIVTHSMQQAARVSQRTAFFHLGELVEEGVTSEIFTSPKEKRTQDYITGRFG